jgi:hypothetical protein
MEQLPFNHFNDCICNKHQRKEIARRKKTPMNRWEVDYHLL